MPRRAVLAGAALLAGAGPSRAAEALRVLSGGALEPAVGGPLAEWGARAGWAVQVAYATAPRIRERLAAGERPDLLLAPEDLLRELKQSGTALGTTLPLGSVGIGVVVRADAPDPSIADEAGLRAALLAAEAVVFNRASTGLYVERMLDRLALAEVLAARVVRFPDGESVLRRVAEGGGRDLGFAAMTEIAQFRGRGARLAGPLPPGLQNRTAYAAAVLPGAPPAAESLLAALGAAPVRAAMAANGVE